MAKKYLTLEEAAAKLSMSTDDLRKLREQGEIRGFADRASWKFRDEDVENYARAMNPNSAASIPVYDDDDQLPITAEEEPSLDDSASDVRLILDDDLLAPGLDTPMEPRRREPQPSADVTADSAIHLGDSDAEITAAGDDTLKVKREPVSPDSAIRLGESDAEITAAGDDTMKVQSTPLSSDSAIRLGDSDSEITSAGDETLKISEREKDLLEGEGSSIRGEDDEFADSGVSLSVGDEDEIEDITYDAMQSQPAEEQESGSDVRLADEVTVEKADSGLSLDDGESSNVRLDQMDEHPDSGISLTTGSDVMQVGDEITLESVQSDVEDSSLADSDVKLVDNDSNVLMEAHEDDDGVTLAAGSSIIGGDEDSGISLEAADSGISLEAADSGISLESLDSGINLTDETTEVDFGLGPEDSGITIEDEDAEKTVTMDSLGGEDDLNDFNDTAFEIDAEEGSSEYEISGLEDNDEEDDTSVLLLDDDDETDAASATLIGGGADDFDDEDAFDLGDDMVDDFGDSDLLVEETVVGDDDELDDLDVFDAVDEDFEDDFGAMGSAGEFAAPVGMRMAAPPEADMGTGVFVGVLVSSIMMAVCCLMMIDLARTMWSYEQPGTFTSPLLDMLKGFF